MNLKQSLKNKLTKKQLNILPRSFDVIGNIAVVNLPIELKGKHKLIANELLKLKNINTVLNKVGRFKGRLRKAQYDFLAGINNFETIHKESGCRIKLDLSKTYFSQRLSNDRLEIAKKIKRNEKVMVFFAGVLPYSIIIAKNSKAKEVHSIELNRTTAKYAKENIKLNKLNNIFFTQGDVKKIIPSFSKKRIKFDRIIMTRPQLKETFLKEAFNISKKGTIIHYHDFCLNKDIPHKSIEIIKEQAKLNKKKIKILKSKIIGDLAPNKSRVRIDFKIL